MKAICLRTEYLKEPLGLGNALPHFFWSCEGGTAQSAYRIAAYRDGETVWDTGKVSSPEMTHIAYGGAPLKSRDKIRWQVTLWDENDEEGAPAESRFEVGLLSSEDWTAKWITGDTKPQKKYRMSVDCFRKKLVFFRKVACARLYASACGVYDVHVNGKRIESFILAPGMTDYRKRIQYQTYDVTALLDKQTTLEIRLADGWYRGSSAAYGVTHVYGDTLSVIAQMEVTYDDGTSAVFGTDDTWEWCNDGPIRFADLKDGEVYDARMAPSYDGKAKIIAAPKAPLVASDNVYVTEHECFTPKLIVNPDGTRILDFGQNIAGYPEFTVKGKSGEQFRLVCGEILDEKGHVDLTGVQETVPAKRCDNAAMMLKLMFGKIVGEPDLTPKQEIRFTCSGGEDHYKSSFTVFGFRYAQIIGDIDIDPEKFAAIAVYSDMEQVGTFRCSNELVERLYENTLWSMKGNFLDLPTDCPTRERLGWSGDGQIFFDTGCYMMDAAAFYRKWIRDMEDAQYKDGIIPAVFPYEGMEMMYRNTGASVGWADAVYLLPYRFYKRFGEVCLLEHCWPMMKKYADYLMKHLGMREKKEAKANPYNKYTYEKGMHLGEWLEPAEFQEKITASNQPKHPEEATAYFYYTMKIMSEIANILGKSEEEELYLSYAGGAKKAYDYLFVKTGTLDTNRQAKLVRPLALGLLNGEDKAYAQKRLAEAAEACSYHVGTGFLSTVFLLPVLTEAGFADTAYKMLENTEKPGWLAEIEAGATTIWETWEGNVSRNHYSPGSVCQWLMEYAAGIRQQDARRFLIAPVPGGTLTFVEGSWHSLYGEVKSKWEKNGNATLFTVTVPANCTAQVRLPDGTQHDVTAGTYSYTIVSE